MLLRALESIGVYTAMTGALDHLEEEVFMSGGGGPSAECWWVAVLQWAPEPEPARG